LNKDIAKRLAAFEKKVFRRMFGRIKVHGNWRKRYNKELMHLFEDLDILSFVGISWLNWIGHVNRMDSKRKLSKNNLQGNRLRGQPKHRWWNCVQTVINECRITNWKERSKNRAG